MSKERYPTKCQAIDRSYRHDRVIVRRASIDDIKVLNQEIKSINDTVRKKNQYSLEAPTVTNMYVVCDLDAKSYHLICVHQVDYRPRKFLSVGNIVKFSKPYDAPIVKGKLKLATPGHYRKQENLQPGIGDPLDGTLTKDGTSWISSFVQAPVSAQLTFATENEPWVFCAAHFRTNRELQNLREYFDQEYGYSEANLILDPNEFARVLGVEFALNVDKTSNVSLQILEQLVRCSYTKNVRDSTHFFDNVVKVYHGPINYENNSGQIQNQNQWFDPCAGPKAWFTKKTCFKKQSEYRFAVSTLGKPVNQVLILSVSDELRSCLSEV